MWLVKLVMVQNKRLCALNQMPNTKNSSRGKLAGTEKPCQVSRRLSLNEYFKFVVKAKRPNREVLLSCGSPLEIY